MQPQRIWLTMGLVWLCMATAGHHLAPDSIMPLLATTQRLASHAQLLAKWLSYVTGLVLHVAT